MQIIPAFFLSLFFALGLWVSAKGIGLYREAKGSAAWPKAKALIEKSEVHSFRRSKGMTHEAVVKYAYVVNGKRYSGNRIRIVFQFSKKREFAEGMVFAYPDGSEVEVSYNPNKYSISVLEPGVFNGTFLGLVGGLGLCAFSLWLMLLWYLLE